MAFSAEAADGFLATLAPAARYAVPAGEELAYWQIRLWAIDELVRQAPELYF